MMDLTWKLQKFIHEEPYVAFTRCHAYEETNFTGKFFIWFD